MRKIKFPSGRERGGSREWQSQQSTLVSREVMETTSENMDDKKVIKSGWMHVQEWKSRLVKLIIFDRMVDEVRF